MRHSCIAGQYSLRGWDSGLGVSKNTSRVTAHWGVAFHTSGGKDRKGEEATGGPTCHWLVEKIGTGVQPTPPTRERIKCQGLSAQL